MNTKRVFYCFLYALFKLHLLKCVKDDATIHAQYHFKWCTLSTVFWGCFSSSAVAVSLNLLYNYYFFLPKKYVRYIVHVQTHWNLLKLVSGIIFWSIFYVRNWKEIVDDYFRFFFAHRLIKDNVEQMACSFHCTAEYIITNTYVRSFFVLKTRFFFRCFHQKSTIWIISSSLYWKWHKEEWETKVIESEICARMVHPFLMSFFHFVIWYIHSKKWHNNLKYGN